MCLTLHVTQVDYVFLTTIFIIVVAWPQERRGSILPPPGMASDNGRMLPGQMMQRNERGGTLAPGAVLSRSDRGLGGMAPPLQPPPVPPIVHNNDRSRQQAMVSLNLVCGNDSRLVIEIILTKFMEIWIRY